MYTTNLDHCTVHAEIFSYLQFWNLFSIVVSQAVQPYQVIVQHVLKYLDMYNSETCKMFDF